MGLGGESVGHFLGLPGAQIIPGKEEQRPDTQDPWEKGGRGREA